jgi:hypothetical protein
MPDAFWIKLASYFPFSKSDLKIGEINQEIVRWCETKYGRQLDGSPFYSKRIIRDRIQDFTDSMKGVILTATESDSRGLFSGRVR